MNKTLLGVGILERRPLMNATDEYYKSIFEIVEQCKKHGLVLYGAGFWGVQSFRIFNKFDVKPVIIVDDNIEKQGKFFSESGLSDECSGVSIVSLEEAQKLYPNAIYISAATPDKKNQLGQMNNKLKAKGLLSKYSGFLPMKYMVLLYGGLESLKKPYESQKNNFKSEYLNNIIVFNHMSNSGSIYFNTLIDNHPNVLNITNLGVAGILQTAYDIRLKYLENEELIIEVAAQLFKYFKWEFPVETFEQTYYCRIADRYFMDANGRPEQKIYIDGADFICWLATELCGKGKVSLGYLLKAVFVAYNNTIGKKYVDGETYWLFYENHKRNFQIESLDSYIRDDFKKIEYWYIIREPVQHIYSLLKFILNIDKRFPKLAMGYYSNPVFLVDVFSSDIGLMLQKNEQNNDKTVRIIRFEDVKRGEEYMRKVCSILDIPYNDCLQTTSFNGVEIYFPTTDNTGKTIVITGNDQTAVKRKDFSELLNSFDIFRLNFITQDFKRAFGYKVDVPHYSEFSPNFIKELYEKPFKFEKFLDEKCKVAKDDGYYSEEEVPECHKYIEDLFIKYTSSEKKELFDNIIILNEELTEL